MDSSADPSLFPLHGCKTLHLVRHAQGIHNVEADKNFKAYMCQEYFDAQITPLGWQQVGNSSKHVCEFGFAKRIDLVIVSPLLRTLQTAVGIFGAEDYTDRMDTVPLMVATAGTSGHAAISSPNCPPIVAIELCREHLGIRPCDKRQNISDYQFHFPALNFFLKGSSEDTLWKADIWETKEKVVARGLMFLNWLKVCFMLLLVCTTGPRGVRSEDIGNPLIPGSTAMDFLLTNKNLRGPSVRRQMVGTESAAMNDNINYHNFPHGNSRPNSRASKKANAFKRSCNAGNYCRQGKKGKKSEQRP